MMSFTLSPSKSTIRHMFARTLFPCTFVGKSSATPASIPTFIKSGCTVFGVITTGFPST